MDQFEELEESSEEAHQDPCRLVRQVNQFLLVADLSGGETMAIALEPHAEGTILPVRARAGPRR